MVSRVLDTDTFSLWARGLVDVEARLLMNPVGSIVTTVITVEEQLGGRMARLRQAKGKEETVRFYGYLTRSAEALKLLPIVSFTSGAYEQFERLKALKLNFDANNDLRIAAIALDLGATVVTRNVRDFNRVPGLVVENWADETAP